MTIYRQERTSLCMRASPEISTCEVPRDVTRKLAADFVCDNGVIKVSLLYV